MANRDSVRLVTRRWRHCGALLGVLVRAVREARARRGRRFVGRLQKLRGFAEELDREIDLADNLRLRNLRRHRR